MSTKEPPSRVSLYTDLLREPQETSCVLVADYNRSIVSLKSRDHSPHGFPWTQMKASAGVLLSYPRFKWLPARLCLWPHHATVSLVYVLRTLQISFRLHPIQDKVSSQNPKALFPSKAAQC